MKIEKLEPRDLDYFPPDGPWPDRPKGHDALATTAPVPLLSYDEMLNLPEPDWLVDGVIPRRAKSVLFGLSNSFKTFHAVDLGGSVSTGITYHGHVTKKCKVIYVANEGANGVGRKRIPAWMAAHNIPQEDRRNIFLCNVETILPDETSRNNLLAKIHVIVKPGEDYLLIIDVLRGTQRGAEKDDEAAVAWTGAAERRTSARPFPHMGKLGHALAVRRRQRQEDIDSQSRAP